MSSFNSKALLHDAGGFKGSDEAYILHTDYIITQDGRVFNTKYRNIKRREMRIANSDKYSIITLVIDGKKTAKSIHRLVAEAFILNPDDKPEVNHIDGNKHNNNISNLEWATRSENMHHAYDTGLQLPNREGHQVMCIDTGETFISCIAADRAMGYSKGNVARAILNNYSQSGGKKWKLL